MKKLFVLIGVVAAGLGIAKFARRNKTEDEFAATPYTEFPTQA